jgi:hypothetical protein
VLTDVNTVLLTKGVDLMDKLLSNNIELVKKRYAQRCLAFEVAMYHALFVKLRKDEKLLKKNRRHKIYANIT